ncbi:hypothetical protein Cgig2_030755 [Carnegiea gigantea]|uniref:Uncharacterized protein n=1 Tax=Carnegiea gigantea TaxID=171969 RepID=A0A9Q1KU04_9CARY|nr:hypothetical protein Cgig2_030755 [Carnegiea gigantea]
MKHERRELKMMFKILENGQSILVMLEIRVVLSDGGIITALAKALGYAAQIASLPILHQPGRLDLATCLNMKLFTTHGGGPLWLNHHGRALFPFPNQPRTTVTNHENLIYDDEAAGEAGAHSDDGSDHGSTDDAEALPRARGGSRRPPSPPAAGLSHPSHPSPAGAMSPSVLQTVLDRLDQLHVQNQEILRNQQHMTHLIIMQKYKVSYEYASKVFEQGWEFTEPE